MKKIIIAIAVIALLVMGVVAYMTLKEDTSEAPNRPELNTTDTTDTASTTPDEVTPSETEESIGRSVRGTEIMAYHYGSGPDELLFVGGIHGGYAWNTVSVASDLMEYLAENPQVIPANVTVTVIPLLNPDGLEATSGNGEEIFNQANVTDEQRIAGRFNANDVDLNRNFDCEWSADAVWQNRTVSGGDKAFSEPEAQAVRSYVNSHDIAAAVVWYSAYGGVFASNCGKGVLDTTEEVMVAYAEAAGYQYEDEFDFYAITGDMTNWLAKVEVPAISVLLADHTNPEWEKNKAGVLAVFELFDTDSR